MNLYIIEIYIHRNRLDIYIFYLLQRATLNFVKTNPFKIIVETVVTVVIVGTVVKVVTVVPVVTVVKVIKKQKL